MNLRIDIPGNKIAEFCRRHHISRLALFGSVLRNDFTPDIDVDILVEFEPGRTPGLEFFTIQDELSEVIGRRVDLYTYNGIKSSRNWILREEILNTAEVQYEQT